MGGTVWFYIRKSFLGALQDESVSLWSYFLFAVALIYSCHCVAIYLEEEALSFFLMTELYAVFTSFLLVLML